MKIKGLEEKIKQTVGRIPILEADNQKKLNQINRLEEAITQKNDRLFQLETLFKGTAKIFSKQHNYVDQLKEQLEQEKKEKGISQEQLNHLHEDIKQLDQQKQELDNRIKELEDEETESKKARDKELADLRKERDELKEGYTKLWDGVYMAAGYGGFIKTPPVNVNKYQEPIDKVKGEITNLNKDNANLRIKNNQLYSQLRNFLKKEASWKGFYTWLIEDLGLREAGNNTLDSVFTKAPNKYKELETSIGWMLFWKSLENTVAERPDFQRWDWTWTNKTQNGTFDRIGTGTVAVGSGARDKWTGTNSSVRTMTGVEIPLPNFEFNKSLWDIFYNKHEVRVFFTNEQQAQFNQIFNDWKQFIQS